MDHASGRAEISLRISTTPELESATSGISDIHKAITVAEAAAVSAAAAPSRITQPLGFKRTYLRFDMVTDSESCESDAIDLLADNSQIEGTVDYDNPYLSDYHTAQTHQTSSLLLMAAVASMHSGEGSTCHAHGHSNSMSIGSSQMSTSIPFYRLQMI